MTKGWDLETASHEIFPLSLLYESFRVRGKPRKLHFDSFSIYQHAGRKLQINAFEDVLFTYRQKKVASIFYAKMIVLHLATSFFLYSNWIFQQLICNEGRCVEHSIAAYCTHLALASSLALLWVVLMTMYKMGRSQHPIEKSKMQKPLQTQPHIFSFILTSILHGMTVFANKWAGRCAQKCSEL